MRNNFKLHTQKIPGSVAISFTIILLVIFCRLLGWFQPLEWKLLDAFFKLRPSEKIDERIVVVKITEEDIKKLSYPISDQKLVLILTKIKNQQPRTIGLDIVRDIPQEPGSEQLIKVLQETPEIWGIEKILGEKFSKFSPHPVLKKSGRVASVDTVSDADGVLRNILLYPEGENKQKLPNLGLAVAQTYLQKQSISSKPGENNYLQLDKTLFVPFQANKEGKSNAGGYININAGGYKVLLNYRGANSFQKVSLSEILDDNISPTIFTDRIVLIGYEAPSIKDLFLTPYSFNGVKSPVYTSGVEVNAHIASMVLSSVLDNRHLIKTSNELLEYILIIFASSIFPLVIWKWQTANMNFNINKFLLVEFTTFSVGILGLFSISYFAFLNGWWIPVGIPITGLLISTIAIVGYTIQDQKLRVDKLNYTWQVITKNISEVILVVHPKNYLISDLKPLGAEFIGYSKNNILNTSFLNYVVEKDKGLIKAIIRDLSFLDKDKDDKITVQFRVIHQDRSERILEATFSNLLDDSSIINSVDVTELMIAQTKFGDAVSRLEEFISPLE